MTALMGLVGAAWQLLVLRFINGIFSGFISMSVSLLASVTPDEHAGRALGILQTGTVAGVLIGPLIGGFLAETIGYRNVFFLTGALLLVASAVVMLFVQEKVTPRPERQKQKSSSLSYMKPLFPVFVASMTTQIGMMTIEPIITIYAKTLWHGGHLAFVAGLVVATTGIANLIGSPFLGQLGDKFGQRKILVTALIMAALAFLPQALAGGLGWLLVGRFLLGLFIGGMIPSLNVLVKKLAPKEILATAFGFNSSALFLGNLIGPLLGGEVAAVYGIRSVFYVTMCVLLLNAVTLAFNRRLDTPPQASG
jgi:MFS transporter, DHA1 family, multidrug resistance protein